MGHQPASLDHMKRFSMANCLTIGLSDCYTAQAMSVDCFNRKVKAGQPMVMPYTDVWPDYTFPRVYKIPTTIETFIFSAYCESLSANYMFPQIGDGVRYTLGASGEIKEIKPFVLRVQQASPQQMMRELKIMDRKIDNMWGKVKKILVFYDCSRGNAEDQRRSAEYDQAALDALGWPVAKVVLEPGEPKYYYGTNTYDPGFTAWSHYTKVTRDNFYNKIAEMENVES